MTKAPKRAAKSKAGAEQPGADTPPAARGKKNASEPAAKKPAAKKPASKKLATKKAVPGKKAAPNKQAASKRARTDKRLPAPDLSNADAGVLDRLFEVVTARRDADPNISHSARLLSRGTAKVAQKFGEEAVECLIEAVGGNSAKLIGESADVLYHLIVVWVDAGVHPGEVWAELRRREGTSGLAEKASRVPQAAIMRAKD